MTPPELEMQAVLRANWEASATDLASFDPSEQIHTGEYERGDSPVPAVVITGGEEGPIGGGDTGYSGLDGGGKGGMQRRGGARTIDCIAGTRADLQGAGANGANLNPKQVRWDLFWHASQLLVDKQLDTDLLWISPGETTYIEEEIDSTGSVEWEFSIQFRAGYGYDRHPR